jgi:hypothetical protein
MMMYNTMDFVHLQVKILLGLLERDNFIHRTKDPNRIGVYVPSSEDGN